MDWQTMIAFPIIFWSVYHLMNGIKDYQRHAELTRALRDVDKFTARIEKKLDIKNEDVIKRVK